MVDSNRWLRLARFREVTLFGISPAELLAHIRTHLARSPVGSEKELFLYQAALSMVFWMDGAEADAAFEALFALGDKRVDLLAVRDVVTSFEIPSAYFERPPRDNTEQSPEELRQEFEKEAEAVRNGSHLGWLTWAARVYFGLFSDSIERARPRERLVAVLGEANAKIAIVGFVAALSRLNTPSLAEVVDSSARHQPHSWWRILTAGLTEHWEANPVLTAFSDDFLKAMLAFDLTNPTFEQSDHGSPVVVPNWKAALMRDRPELVRDAYVAIARAKLASDDQIVDGLRELMLEDAFKSYRGGTALQLLRDFPNANLFRLGELFDGVLGGAPATRSDLLVIADNILSGPARVGQQQHDKWLAVAYLLSPNRYEAQVQNVAGQRPSIVFELRDHCGFGPHSEQQYGALTMPQLEFLAKLTGTHYSDTGFPSGGLLGSTNAWDAAEFCRKLIDAISAIPSQAASEALRRLETDTAMTSYNPHLRHALANQEKRRQEAEYDRPDWPSTIKALSNGAPATVADLHAMLLDQLNDICARIASENTDIYKFFWNLDRYSRPLAPRPEEACRDALATLLRPVLAPKGVTVEPEGHMVADKRADISVAMPGRKILCELKRDYHADLWTAADQQLERFYAHDPEARGFGIYGVFWFGDKRGSPIPKHPDELQLPKSADELEQMLRDRVGRGGALVLR